LSFPRRRESRRRTGKTWIPACAGMTTVIIMNIVLQKYLAERGVCSRRKAEELIKKRKIKINEKVAELGDRVGVNDKVYLSDKQVGLAKEKIYIILNKPIGYTCTNRKFRGEKNVFDLVEIDEKLVIAGRLDKDSRGLVILTNDGELVNKITHPKYSHEKKYEAKVRSSNLEIKSVIEKFKKGIEIGGRDGIVKAKDIKYLNNNNFEITLVEGKKRQIRRMFEKVNCGVVDLNRISIGKIKLGSLQSGKWKKIKKLEI